MAVKNIVKAIPLKTLAAGSFASSYVLITAASGLPQACFLLRIINNSSEDITVSYDGTTDNDFLPHGAYLDINAQTNSQPNNQCALFPVGMQVWIKATDSMGSGSAYLAGYYQPSVG